MNMKKLLPLSLFTLLMALSAQSYASMLGFGIGGISLQGVTQIKFDFPTYNVEGALYNLLQHKGGKGSNGFSLDGNMLTIGHLTINQEDGYHEYDEQGGDDANICRDNNCEPVASVPEPGTIFLLGLGLVAVFYVSRRKAPRLTRSV